MKDIVLIGTGGFAREVAWLIERNNEINPEWNILGYVDECSESELLSYPIIGDDNWLLNYSMDTNVAICIGNPELRKKVALKLKKNQHIHFPSLVSIDARVGKSNKLEEGTIICAGTVITINAHIGAFSILNLNCTVGHEAKLGKYVTLYPDVNVSGDVHIGETVEIGTGSAIIQGINIGKQSIVGAGSVVVKNLPSNCTAVGVPAKVIKSRNI